MGVSKKLLNHAIEIAKKGNVCFDDKYVYAFDNYRIIRLDKEYQYLFLTCNRWREAQYVCAKNFKLMEDRGDYEAHRLPSIKSVKDGIKEIVGRGNFTGVSLCLTSDTGINGGFLIRAMESLKCENAYISHDPRSPICFMEGDDYDGVRELIMPVLPLGRTGMWKNEAPHMVKTSQGIKKMTYTDVCRELGFDPSVKFIKVTNRGTITFTTGKPAEVKALKAACMEKGFEMAKSLENITV